MSIVVGWVRLLNTGWLGGLLNNDAAASKFWFDL